MEDYQALVYAYCIMGNHYHVVLQNTEANLSKIMHDVGSSFASHLRKQGRIGHIFSGRYKSIYLEGRERLLYLSKYVHLNPVRASMVERPEDFDWSSYRFFAWDLEPPEWLYVDWLKGCLKPASKMTHKSYREFVEGSANLPSDSEENRGTARAIIKCERFLQDIMDDGCEGKVKDATRLDSLYS